MVLGWEEPLQHVFSLPPIQCWFWIDVLQRSGMGVFVVVFSCCVNIQRSTWFPRRAPPKVGEGQKKHLHSVKVLTSSKNFHGIRAT
jgi:hypothetical protein